LRKRQSDWGWFVNIALLSSLRKQGPIATGSSLAKSVCQLGLSRRHNAVWVPAFAGTTVERAAYVAAVVTPPSTTIVWPVMKVEASEAR
jgi:hypothetical protein